MVLSITATVAHDSITSKRSTVSIGGNHQSAFQTVSKPQQPQLQQQPQSIAYQQHQLQFIQHQQHHHHQHQYQPSPSPPPLLPPFYQPQPDPFYPLPRLLPQPPPTHCQVAPGGYYFQSIPQNLSPQYQSHMSLPSQPYPMDHPSHTHSHPLTYDMSITAGQSAANGSPNHFFQPIMQQQHQHHLPFPSLPPQPPQQQTENFNSVVKEESKDDSFPVTSTSLSPSKLRLVSQITRSKLPKNSRDSQPVEPETITSLNPPLTTRPRRAPGGDDKKQTGQVTMAEVIPEGGRNQDHSETKVNSHSNRLQRSRSTGAATKKKVKEEVDEAEGEDEMDEEYEEEDGGSDEEDEDEDDPDYVSGGELYLSDAKDLDELDEEELEDGDDRQGSSPALGYVKPDRQGYYHCTACKKKFTRNSNLTRHFRIHNAVKRFKCKKCNKKFMEKHHLEAHMRVHTGLRPYQCPRCSRQFTDRSNCSRHIRTHGPGTESLSPLMNPEMSPKRPLTPLQIPARNRAQRLNPAKRQTDGPQRKSTSPASSAANDADDYKGDEGGQLMMVDDSPNRRYSKRERKVRKNEDMVASWNSDHEEGEDGANHARRSHESKQRETRNLVDLNAMEEEYYTDENGDRREDEPMVDAHVLVKEELPHHHSPQRHLDFQLPGPAVKYNMNGHISPIRPAGPKEIHPSDLIRDASTMSASSSSTTPPSRKRRVGVMSEDVMGQVEEESSAGSDISHSSSQASLGHRMKRLKENGPDVSLSLLTSSNSMQQLPPLESYVPSIHSSPSTVHTTLLSQASSLSPSHSMIQRHPYAQGLTHAVSGGSVYQPTVTLPSTSLTQSQPFSLPSALTANTTTNYNTSPCAASPYQLSPSSAAVTQYFPNPNAQQPPRTPPRASTPPRPPSQPPQALSPSFTRHVNSPLQFEARKLLLLSALQTST